MVISSWPRFSSAIDKLDKVYAALQPILTFLESLDRTLNNRICYPNPAELLHESQLVERISQTQLPERVSESQVLK